jgi:putative oxidoreductase
MKKLFQLSFIPSSYDFGLLVLRVWLGISLFSLHGIEKLFGFADMLAKAPDPIHIGPLPGLIFATLSDGICSILVLLGLFTRLSALIIVINLFVVFAFMRGFSFVGTGQVVYIYLGAYLAIFAAGAGRYSIDNYMK